MPLALFVAVTAISFAAIFFRKAQPTHPLVAAGIRLTLASVILLPISWRAWRRGTLRTPEIRAGMVAGLLYGLHFGSWVWSLGLTTVAASVTLVTATPLMLALVGVATGRDRPEGKLWLSLGLAVVGVVLIGGTDLGRSTDALIGDGLAVVGAAAMAGYLVLVRRLPADLDVLGFSGVACAVGAAALALAALVAGTGFAPASDEALMYLVLAALVPQIIGHGLLTWSLRHTTPVVVGIATVGEPVGASILGWFWLGEAVPPLVAVGCAVTLSAVVLAVARYQMGEAP